MFKLTQEIETSGGVTEINRYNNILTAYDGVQDLIEIDMKHELIIRNKLQYPPINVKCFNWQGKWEYFIVTLDQIQKNDGIVVSHSNSKSQFTGNIDCFGGSLIFTKFHHNYKKHSINYLWEGTKKIVKLVESPIKKLAFNPFSFQVIYNTKDCVNCLDLNNYEKDVQLFKKSNFLSDNNNLYTLSLNLQNKSKEEYELGIFDFRTGKNSDSFLSKQPPIKIQSFSRTLLVATRNAIEFFDLRKLIKPYDRQPIKGIKDFLYDPNLNKLFIGCQQKLRVYRSQN